MLILKTWLQYLTDLDFFGLFMKIIRSIFLALDGVIYAIISYCYEVFTFISEIRVFENEDMVNLANRIYILIGVVSLFLVAYTLLNAIINPENATKDKNKSFAGIVKNIILAIIGIAIVPTIFDYAYEFQSRVLCNNVIQKFFLENNITEDDDARAKMGAQMSLYLFKSFYYIKGSEDDTSLDENANSNWETMAQSIVSDNDDSYNLSMAFSDIELGNRSISEALGDFDDSIDSGKLGYLFLISTLAGAFCAYVILGFVIDMGVRAVKLAYLQLIAPLPILTLILPNQKKVFDNWLKKTSSCFIEVFTRIIAMSFAFYAIKYLRPWIFNDMSTVSCGRTVGAVTKLLAQAAFIVGVFAFLKQLPKFIKDLLPGFDSAGFKLGFGNAFAEAGGFQALGMIGGTASSAAKSINLGISKFKDTRGKNIFTRAGAALGAAGNVIPDTLKGGYKALNGAKDAKKWSDSKEAIQKASDEVIEDRLTKDEWNETNNDGKWFWGVRGHTKDAYNALKEYASTYEATYAHLKKSMEKISKVTDATKSLVDAAGNVVSKNEGTFVIRSFKYKDGDGQDHIVNNNTETIATLRKMAEHQAEVAKQTCSITDIKNATAAQNKLDAAIKTAKADVISGTIGTEKGIDGNQHMNADVYKAARLLSSALEENQNEILNHLGYEPGTAAYNDAVRAINDTLRVNVTSDSPTNFANLGTIINVGTNAGQTNGLSKVANTSKTNVAAETNDLENKIQQKKENAKK